MRLRARHSRLCRGRGSTAPVPTTRLRLSVPVDTIRSTGGARRHRGSAAGDRVATSARAAWAAAATGRSAGASPVRRVPWVPLALTVAAYLAGSLALHHRLLPQLTTA